MMILCGNDVEFSIQRRNTKNIKEIGGVKLFGDHILTNHEIGRQKEALLSKHRKFQKVGERVELTPRDEIAVSKLI